MMLRAQLKRYAPCAPTSPARSFPRGHEQPCSYEGCPEPAEPPESLAENRRAEDGRGERLGERQRHNRGNREVAESAAIERVGNADGDRAKVQRHDRTSRARQPSER